jgi:hypothetical protein
MAANCAQDSAAVAAPAVVKQAEFNNFNRTHTEALLKTMSFFEKNKLPYCLVAITAPADDKRVMKKLKKITVNNKYILFNTSVSKCKYKKLGLPPNHVLWNKMKESDLCPTMFQILNHIENVGKRLFTKQPESGSAKGELSLDEVKEINTNRKVLYNEFNEALMHTMERGVAPDASTIYDSQLTRAILQKAVSEFEAFIRPLITVTDSTIVSAILPPVKDNDVPAEASTAVAVSKRKRTKSKKRSRKAKIVNVVYKDEPKPKRKRTAAVVYNHDSSMMSDSFDNSQMSA